MPKSQRSRSSGVGGGGGGWAARWKQEVLMVCQRGSCLTPHSSLRPAPTVQVLGFMNGEQQQASLAFLCTPLPPSWAGVSSPEPAFPNKSSRCALSPQGFVLGCHLGRSGFLLSSPKSSNLPPPYTHTHCSWSGTQHIWELSLKKP